MAFDILIIQQSQTRFEAGANDHLFNTFNLQAFTTRRIGDWALLNRLVIPPPYVPASAIMGKTGTWPA